MTASTLQTLFWRGVRYQPAPDDVIEAFRGDSRLSAAERIEIYRNAYWYRQVEVLADLLPRLFLCMGEGPFAKTASRFLREKPSTSWALEHLATSFADWLRTENHTDWADVAAIESAKLEALLARDSDIVSAPQVDAQTFVEMRLGLAPHLHLVPVSESGLRAFDDSLLPVQAGGALAVWRQAFDVYLKVIDPNELEALSLARKGLQLGPLCEVLANGQTGEDAALNAFHLLHAWFQRGWISELT